MRCSANAPLWHNTASTSIIGTISSAHMSWRRVRPGYVARAGALPDDDEAGRISSTIASAFLNIFTFRLVAARAWSSATSLFSILPVRVDRWSRRTTGTYYLPV